MEYKGLTCSVQPFSTAAAYVKAEFDIAKVIETFNQELPKRLAKKGLNVLPPGADPGTAQVVVSGRITQVDEGNRWLRYFLTFFAGHAVLEVEGEATVMTNRIATLHHRASQGCGLFGGSALGLLQACAQSCAGKVADQVVKALKSQG